MSTKSIAIGAAIVILLGGGTATALSNLPLRSGHAELRASDRQDRALAGLSELRTRAPYGTYVIEYDVVANEQGLALGGKRLTEAPLFGTTSIFTNFLPDHGFDADLPLETPVRITPAFSGASATRMPTEAEAPRVGTWVLITKDRGRYDELATIADAAAQ